MATDVINSLFVLTLIGLLVLIVMMIILIYRANHVVNNWSKVSDTVSDSLVKLIPAVLNMATIGKAIHEVLATIAELKKKEKKKD